MLEVTNQLDRDSQNAAILVIDDEPGKVHLVTELLKLGGFTNTHSEMDSSRALACYRELKPDLIVLDLHMEPLDGFQVMAQVQPEFGAGEFLPVLMLTGDISREVRERALSAGAMDFLAKPFNANEIVLRVKNLVRARMLYLALQSERDLLEERVEERTFELVEARNEILERLALVAEYRDDATGAHTARVSAMVRAIALEMKLPAEEADLYGRAALLHDLGKVALADSILLKQGRLTEAEYTEVKRHAQIGGEILKGSRSVLLQCAEQIARYHHERWNGMGYMGLESTNIPLAARITAVADVYDALTTDRPYKDAWKQEAAISEIQRLSGTHFDPDAVEALLRVVGYEPQTDRNARAA